ncbi:MAG: diaminopimelate epimerase, partial [bacterium]
GFPVERYGPLIERHRAFPERTNVHFVEVLRKGEVRLKTWERGSGLTLACGTGAAAVCVAGVLNKKTARKILAHLPGGDLILEWSKGGAVFMTGPAEEVFSGEWPASHEYFSKMAGILGKEAVKGLAEGKREGTGALKRKVLDSYNLLAYFGRESGHEEIVMKKLLRNKNE